MNLKLNNFIAKELNYHNVNIPTTVGDIMQRISRKHPEVLVSLTVAPDDDFEFEGTIEAWNAGDDFCYWASDVNPSVAIAYAYAKFRGVNVLDN